MRRRYGSLWCRCVFRLLDATLRVERLGGNWHHFIPSFAALGEPYIKNLWDSRRPSFLGTMSARVQNDAGLTELAPQ
jgi:hypothetical protein